MDKTATPEWGFGCKPVTINPFPASFVTFFPAANDEKEGNAPKDISWADNLVARKPRTCLPAWCRVAVQAHPSTLRKGSIMKRVGVSTRNPLAVSNPASASTAAAPESPGETAEPARHIRRKLQYSVPSEEELELSGTPLSQAEIASHIMRAKVDVTNCLLTQSYDKLFYELRQSKTNLFTKKTVPTKRRFTDYSSSINLEYASGGNRMATYFGLDPIIQKAAETGVDEVNVNMASIAAASANLRYIRRNPRVHLAAAGTTDLADITDLTEPDSPLALAKPYQPRADAKSPTKKTSPLSSSPVRGSPARLSDTLIRLLPAASSPKVEPSPTKSSAPSTPMRESPRPGGTPSIIPRSPLAQSPLQQRSPSPETKTPSSVRLLQGPFKNLASPGLQPIPQSPTVRESPTKIMRPVAPTPSRWNRPEPSTPYQLFTPTAYTPTDSQNQSPSPLGLLASVPTFLKSNLSPIRPVMGEPMNIDFGTTSPSFDHASWLNSPINAGEVERTKILRRRKSEPLIRNCLIAQTRRKSLSPQKLVTKSDNTQMENASDAVPFDLSGDNVQTSNQKSSYADSTNVTMDDSTATPVYTQYIKNMRATATDSPTPAGRFSIGGRATEKNGIFDIDMRQNPDIFGAQTPTAPSNTAVERLARIAKDRCNDEANVFVTEENGRLIVRFKLSMEFASMFPESQGPDESRFSMSPSISSSPRIRFQSQNVSTEDLEESTAVEIDQLELNNSPNAMEHTLVVSDFGSSPQKPANPNKMDKTLVVSDFGSSPQRPADSTAVDKTLVVSDFGSSPVAASDMSDDTAISCPSFIVAGADTTIPGLMDSPSNVSNTPLRSGSSSPLSELESTIDDSNGLGMTGIALPTDTEMTSTPARASTVETALVNDTPAAATSTLTASFTPVNQNSRSQTSTPSPAPCAEPKENEGPGDDDTESKTPASNHDDESPGREYMRDFIKRSRPKRLSTTTDTGSPIAQPKRLPLGIRSPNMESSQKGKRKFDADGSENDSETKQEETEPSPKRARRVAKATPRKAAAESKPEDKPDLATDTEETTEDPESADAQEDDAEPDDAPAARRSSRLRTKSATTSKSSIPTPIKVGRSASPALNSMRHEQQELNQQTRMNTRKNKGNAEYPAQVLARCSEEAEDDILEQQEMEIERGRGAKSVGWKEPLAAFHDEKNEGEKPQDEKPKKGKAAPKTKAKPETNRVTKPAPKATSTTQRQRSARVAASLGMAGNGTPAKRVTRSSTRTAQ